MQSSRDSRRSGLLATLTCATVVCLMWLLPAPVAATAAGLIVIPHPTAQPGLSYFKLQPNPGRSAQAGTIELRNPTARSQRVELTPVDGTTLDTLGSTYRPPGSRPSGSTRWLYIGRRIVTLPAGTSAVVPIAVNIPRAARPGDYLSGVSIEALHQNAHADSLKGVSIASVVRYAIGVEVSLPGPRHPRIRLTGASLQRQPAGLTFQLQAVNSGNVILQGVYGHVHIWSAGRTILSRSIAPGTFIAHTAIAYPVPAFHQTPVQGTRYRISAWMRYSGGIARLDETVTFGHGAAVVQQRYSSAHPPTHDAGSAWWKLALLIAALLYGVLTTILLARRRSRDRRPHEASTQRA
jgi:hypothetical protein